MKTRQTSLILLIIALICGGLTALFIKQSDEIINAETVRYEFQKREKERKQPEKGEAMPFFGFSDGYERELNYADCLGIFFFGFNFFLCFCGD